MRNLFISLFLCFALILPVNALEIYPPAAPAEASDLMPESTESFGAGLAELLQKGLQKLRPDLMQASRVCVSLVAAVMLISVLQTLSSPLKGISGMAGTTVIAGILLMNTQSMIRLAADTVSGISDYGKLLLPVMTSAMAAQGRLTASAAIYAGSAFFSALLTNLISGLLIPMVYIFLALSAANSATGEDLLKRMASFVRDFMSWILKTSLMVFTTYISITGVVSGTTDAAALKATKVTISSVVPVVGGILSDASEAVLVSAGLMKNAAGLYGIFAVIALLLEPFLQIGSHYLILKLTAAICGIFGTKQTTDLIGDFSSAMGLLLGMTGASCLIVLISTVCFMKGVG